MRKAFILPALCLMILSLLGCSGKKFESMPEKTDLEFWITEDVAEVDFSDYAQEHGWMGATVYYGKGYEPVTDEYGEQIDPPYCVKYKISAYPDYSDGGSYVTHIFVSDPEVRVRGLTTLATGEDFILLYEGLGYEVSGYDNGIYEATKGSFTVVFDTAAKTFTVEAKATNTTGIDY